MCCKLNQADDMQYLVLSLGDARGSTSTIYKSLNPEWDQTIELPVSGIQSAILTCACWDKDRFGKDYMGEFECTLEEIFANKKSEQLPRWLALESRRQGKKASIVTGEIQLQFTLVDSSNPTTTSDVIMQHLHTLISTSNPDLTEVEQDLETEADAAQDSAAQDSTAQDSTAEVTEKKKRRLLRIAKIKKKAKDLGYAFNSSSSSLAGVLFLEVQKIVDLPPEKNVTRTGFDMDPFVIVSLGRKTFRTRVVRHNLNPVWDEKLVFQVPKNEVNYSLGFTVVDRDNFSGNDYVGRIDLSLDKIVATAPEPDTDTGLFNLPAGAQTPSADPKKSRFRLPLSRSSSQQSLKLSKTTSTTQPLALSSSLSVPVDDLAGLGITSAPTSAPTSQPAGAALDTAKIEQIDESLTPFVLPLVLKNKDKWESKHNPTLFIRTKYLPYQALRQQFWRTVLRQYDADESGRIDKVELTTMLDSLGSTLHESTIDKFFSRFPESTAGQLPSLSFDEAVICLEDELLRTSKNNKNFSINSSLSHAVSNSTGDDSGATTPYLTNLSFDGSQHSQITGFQGYAEEPISFDTNDLNDDRGEEHVIEIRECPICHQPRLNKRTDSDIITHIATCASQDWRKVNNIVMGGFVTASQAQRKWYSKVVTKISYGGYKLGANSANILVQDRTTGLIEEERMSVYVRLGIRLLYKGLKSSAMEQKRAKKLLKSMSVKQGRKYDDPASAREIGPFIAFHQLDMSEVLLPMNQFKNFNEFFYRALKPEARPCSAPTKTVIVTSPADCRSVVFNQLDVAQKIWVKGRDFTVERLLGKAYPEDAKRYTNGALGIFRLAPQDYHRFHIPVDGVLDEPKAIEGEYYTVNPMAIRSQLDVYGDNVRVIVPIDSVSHGRVMVICVGAMMVGSTVITRKKGETVKRAEELGYFKFGKLFRGWSIIC
jgi:phosphatidylserine decarboxylase